MGPISPIVRGLINGFSLGNMLRQQQMDQRRMEMQAQQQQFDQEARQSDLLQRVTAAGARPVTASDQYEMDGGTAVVFNEGLPITGGPSITTRPTDLPSRVLQIPGGGPRVVLPTVDETDARAAAFNQRTLLDRNRANAEAKAAEIKMQEEAAARMLDATGITLPPDLAKRFGMDPGRKIAPTQIDDLMRADTYRQSVTQPARKEVINTYRYQGPGGMTERVVFKDGTFEDRAMNGQQLPARAGAGRAKAGAGGAPKEQRPSFTQTIDALTVQVLEESAAGGGATIDDALKNVRNYYKNDPRFTTAVRQQIETQLKKQKVKEGDDNPYYKKPAAAPAAAGSGQVPANPYR